MFKSKQLKAIFYRNFMLLIVIPILLIIIIALGSIRNMMVNSAVDKIQLAQNNILSMLEKELGDTALKLSHFLQSNNNQILELASKYNLADGNEKYEHIQKISRLLELMIIPKNDVVGIHFYMKDGRALCLKDDLAIPLSEVRQNQWYQSALTHKDRTFIGGFVEGVTYRKGYLGGKMIVVSFAPEKTDPYNQIELVCFYLNSNMGDMINKYEKQPELGRLYLVNERNDILIGEKEEGLPEAILEAEDGGYKIKKDKKDKYYNVSSMYLKDWRVINAVDAQILLTEFNQISKVIIFTAIILFILFLVFSNGFLKNIINPINELIVSMKKVNSGDLTTQVEVSGQEELKQLGHSFNNMIVQIRELIESNEKQQKEKHSIEIKALQSQINPHFLFNTLSSIRFMAMVAKFDSIKNMSEALMKIMANAFKSPNSFYSVAEEMEVLQSYSYLMKIRYSDNFEVIFDIPAELLAYQIPRLLIQPILENAITHGFETMEGIGQISVGGKVEKEVIVFTISDNGKGISESQIRELLKGNNIEGASNMGIGVSNVNRRIKLTYGEQYGLQIESMEGKYTKVHMYIPCIKGEKEE